MQEDWPPRWELTAPESHVLSYRGGTWRGEAIRLAVVELVARGILRIESVEPARRQSGTVWALADGAKSGSDVEPPLDVVLDLVRQAPWQQLQAIREGSTMAVPVEGVLVKDLRRVVRKEFGQPYKYWERHVAPALVDRGLLWLTRPRKRGGAAEFDWTVAGREADAQLSRWLELAREHLADWVASDPPRASVFTREAGSAVLLMRDQYPELEELGRRAGTGVFELGGGEAFAAGHPAGAHHADAFGQGGEGLHLDGLGLDFGGLMDFGGIGDFGGGGDGGGGGGGDGGGGGGG